MTSRGRTFWKATVALTAVAALGGCALFDGKDGDEETATVSRTGIEDTGGGGRGFLGLGGGGGGGSKEDGIGVNSFLWRASLDTLSFMPLASADPWGGVIITDWYTNPEKPNERFKATVYILDSRLRADGLKVSIFRQALTANGSWADQNTDAETAIQIENAILTRARQLRLSTIG